MKKLLTAQAAPAYGVQSSAAGCGRYLRSASREAPAAAALNLSPPGMSSDDLARLPMHPLISESADDSCTCCDGNPLPHAPRQTCVMPMRRLTRRPGRLCGHAPLPFPNSAALLYRPKKTDMAFLLEQAMSALKKHLPFHGNRQVRRPGLRPLPEKIRFTRL